MAYRILVVEDEIEVVTMLDSFLRRNGYHVSRALDGAEAILKVAEQPDLILLDIPRRACWWLTESRFRLGRRWTSATGAQRPPNP